MQDLIDCLHVATLGRNQLDYQEYDIFVLQGS